MIVTYQLLKDYIDFNIPVEELSERLTMQGLEVEEIKPFSPRLSHVKVALIKAIEKHPNADKLSICTVTNGNEDLQIICGASNMSAGDKVCLAMIGAKLPDGMKIKKAKMRGVESFGMLCSKDELGLEGSTDGIWILPPEANAGDDINDYLPDEDVILDISLTANRGDCLSLVGVAREIAGMVSHKITYPKIEIKTDPDIEKPNIQVLDENLCQRYVSRIIKGIKVKESPKWLQEALIKLGSRPINNIVDITNFVQYELGHPLHAFDLNKLKGRRILVRKAHEGEHLIGIDGIERKLDDGMLVIADEKTPVAIAGVMGGDQSGVTDQTVDLLLESAWFLPESIRGTSKKLDLSTESSYRFERITDINGLVRSLDRCAQLIQETSGGEISELVDVYPNKVKPCQLDLRISFVNDRLGTQLSKEDVRKALEPLEFHIKDKDKDCLTLTIPSFKTDVYREIDVVEEIVRIYGYDNIPETIPPLNLNPDNLDTKESIETRIQNALIGFGLNEIVNYSFTSEKELKSLYFPHNNLIQTKNPLTADNESLRNGLFHGMFTTILHNINHGNRYGSFFEIGDIFYRDGDRLVEQKKLSIALYGYAHEKGLYAKDRLYDFYDLKGLIEGLFDKLGLDEVTYQTKVLDFLHPSKGASLMIKDQELAYMGECHPQVLESHKCPYPIVYCEMDLDTIRSLQSHDNKYQEISKFPELLRDLAILVDETLLGQRVIDEISKSSKYIKRVKLVDVYQGEHIPKGKKSLAFSLSFQDQEKTLVDDLVAKEYDHIIDQLRKNCGGEMRAI
ncbi:MAG TPA: phenylalanine--tRNA ligase subunit beta [Spirochaetes bacterium]|nr:phenylalanine--tRNA ligase subunit beta [Spirochaetota bacterium]